MAWHRKIVQQAFFILIFVLVSTVGVAYMLGVPKNEILVTAVNAVISTCVAVLLTVLVFAAEGRHRR